MERTQRIVENHVLYCQSSLLDDLVRRGMFFEQMRNDEILEWWLVTPWLARRLQDNNETVLAAFGCCWWGRTTSGQAIFLDSVINEIAAD